MRKILSFIVVIFVSLLIPGTVLALTTDEASEKIDLTRNSSFTLNYYYDNYKFDNTMVKIYYIASVSSDFRYQLSSRFSGCSVKVNGLTTDDEWNYVKKVLDDYIVDNNVVENISQVVSNNTVTFNNLESGLYLVKTDKISINNSDILIDTSLISVPILTENGTWDYDIDIYPKALEEFIDNKEQSPDTGDNISIYFYLLLLSFICIIGLIVSFIFRRSKIRIDT